MKKWLLFVINLILVQGYAQDQKGNTIGIGDNTEIINSIIVGGDYYGLTQDQQAELKAMSKTIKGLENKILGLAKKSGKEKEDREKILSLSEQISNYQRRLERLITVNDSIVLAADKDSLFYKKLEIQYDQQLEFVMADFWESHPNFNPENKMKCLEYLERKTGKLYNIHASSSQHILEFRRCNTCVRKYSGEWLGVKLGGMNYYFSGRGLNYLGAPPSKNFNALTLEIPKHGSVSISELQTHYRNYWTLKNNKSKTINQQYSLFIKNPRQNIYDIVSNDKPCNQETGDLNVYNRLGEKLTIWLCSNHTNCSARNSNYKISIEDSNKGSFYNIPKGVYNYFTYRGSGLMYKHTSGQVRINGCKEEEITIN